MKTKTGTYLLAAILLAAPGRLYAQQHDTVRVTRIDTAVVRISPEAYNSVLSLYKNPIMGLGEMALVAAIVYHAFNGIRIILIDFWGPATNSKVEHIQKPNKDGIIETSEKATYNHIKILWVVLVLWVIFVAGFAVRHLPNVFAHIGGH